MYRIREVVSRSHGIHCWLAGHIPADPVRLSQLLSDTGPPHPDPSPFGRHSHCLRCSRPIVVVWSSSQFANGGIPFANFYKWATREAMK